jgi:ribosomal-protein-alanine N-acetyltransferase
MKVKEAKEEDLEKILEIEKICFRGIYSYSLEDIFHFFVKGTLLVAEEEENILGYIAGEIREEVSRVASICVHPDFRKKGIGKALLEKFERKSKETSKLILLECNRSNPSLDFFLKMKFGIIGLVLNYYDLPFNNSRDAFLLVKPI